MLLFLSTARRRAQAGCDAWKEGKGDTTKGHFGIIPTQLTREYKKSSKADKKETPQSLLYFGLLSAIHLF
ncbi:hypothetical protein EO95_18280 [Methanosarcina sp. 1.H.T.1A.1]|nr:hypothetical protein EO92_12625 [Methanosarcina sp. 2.H.A.1B.4]KKH94470.1 hypothetical protein EO95_18280 [Methanosarcina sp. 1.H.T.1A.1]